VLGDAAFAARPHAAAGTAKAAENAWALTVALGGPGCDVAAAIAAWEPGQLELGRNLVQRAKEIGERSQVSATWKPGDPALRFGLRGPGN
jgi:2,6-dihydroxypyridine 3-monooxygenase